MKFKYNETLLYKIFQIELEIELNKVYLKKNTINEKNN